MPVSLSTRIERIQASPTMAVAALAMKMKREGMDVINLGVGEPDFDTPAAVREAAIEAINQGFTKYTAVDGIPELKQAVIDKLKRDNELSYSPSEIIISAGGKQCCYNLAQAVLNPGDEVVILAPYWVSYPAFALLADAQPVYVKAGIEQGFKITAKQLESAITAKTRLIYLNTPSNPSGMAYSADELKALAKVLMNHPKIVIGTDDMYEHILWNKTPFTNILNVCPELANRTVVINAVSKTYAMTGWRIGYAAGPVEVIAAMEKVQSQSTSNPCSISQKAAVAALNGDQAFVLKMASIFKTRHDYLVESLNQIPGIRCLPGDGTFYAFPCIQEAMKTHGFVDDTAFCQFLLEKAQVAVVPGSAFGLEGYMRLSYAVNEDTLRAAMQRIAGVL